ncbi:MAG: hypothetical protein ABJE95_00015 [Byssovorax sp.]
MGAGTVGGCLNRPLEPNEPRRTSTIVEPFTQSAVDKIDLVLMIDNSRSMADKQLILAAAVPDLVGALVNPKCVDPKGTPMTTQPATVSEMCPAGLVRDFKPITNIHIGIITSSLGGHGGDACSVTNDVQSCPGGPNPSNNDAGHLISRKDACGGALVPTYGNKGFLAWDPDKKLAPPGETEIGSIAIDAQGNVTTATPGIVPSLKDLVQGAGQVGCGYESQLESWYRFLIDPEPYKDITLQGGKATPSGTDRVLLQQRADFLRPSSLLAIIMLTDENDCSVKESGQFYYAVQQQNPQDNKKKFHLPRARKECATNPNDPCCKSCGQMATNCPADAMCMTSPTLSDAEDDINLRCFDQKRRFGIDFLYGIDRYRDALSSKLIPNRAGMMVTNPIFTDLNPMDEDSSIRDKGLVFIAGIVGVPWQDIARTDKNGQPDLLTGLDKDNHQVGGFKNAEEMSTKDANGVTPWDVVLGDPANYVAAKDPHMIESVQPRAGLPGVTSPAGTDPINGHEYTIMNNDLQYACIFALPSPRDCSVMGVNGCDCNAGSDNPLCDPATKTLQVRAKGYPGLRELATLKAAASQGIVASVCPTQLTDKTKDDYGYRPAIGSIIARLKTALGGKCLPRQLTPDPKTGQVPCLIIEASTVKGSTACDIKSSRREVKADNSAAIDVARKDLSADPNWNKFCEIIQTGDVTGGSTQAQLDACQQDSSAAPVDAKGNPVNGWCYVDPGQNIKSNAEIVKSCADTEKRLIRFVGNGNPSAGGQLFITCTGE